MSSARSRLVDGLAVEDRAEAACAGCAAFRMRARQRWVRSRFAFLRAAQSAHSVVGTDDAATTAKGDAVRDDGVVVSTIGLGGLTSSGCSGAGMACQQYATASAIWEGIKGGSHA